MIFINLVNNQLKKVGFYPYFLFKKIFLLIKKEINEYRYPFKKRYSSLIKTYIKCNFNQDRNVYIKSLNKKLLSLGFKAYNELEGMYSEHLIIFAALAKSNNEIRNILEIGTHNGKTACILARLFPLAKITTIDLKDSDPKFRNTYSRKDNFKLFIKKRNNLLSKERNINFIQINSLELSNFKKSLPIQDLIWVDGAHGYPIVTSDITNSITLMDKRSILMCDDIWKKSKRNDDMYESTAGFETLNSFEEAKIIKTHYFRKRINKLFNGNYKYISFSKLL